MYFESVCCDVSSTNEKRRREGSGKKENFRKWILNKEETEITW